LRKLLIAHHRQKTRQKKGGHLIFFPLNQAIDQIATEFQRTHGFDFDALEEALQQLKRRNPRQYEVINYRFFGGLSVAETADILKISVGSVERDWRLARAKLFSALRDRDE
jgi:RNA polymerase sigma factor (sigma-70 family)